MKAFLVLLCLVSQLVLPIWMWNFPNCYDIAIETDQACCVNQVRNLFKAKDARFVECLSSQEVNNEEATCEESFSEDVDQIIEEHCTEKFLDPIEFRALNSKCTIKRGDCLRMNWSGKGGKQRKSRG